MVDIKNLQFAYKKKPLYKDFNLNFEAGHIYGLLGKNGSGKTTLLGLISGNLFAKDGDINTLGYNPKDRDAFMLSQIFYLPEQFLLPLISSKDYVKLYAVFYPNFNHSDFERYTKEFEVEDVKKLKSLSMGQQKKFLLSFGLATNCPLNLLDEPTNGLDIPSKTIFRRLIAASADKEKTFIISTHQIKDIENLINQVSMISDGQVALNSSLEALSNGLEMIEQSDLDGFEIYSEDAGLGKLNVIRPNDGTSASSIDLELLFNATLTNSKEINKVLGEKNATSNI